MKKTLLSLTAVTAIILTSCGGGGFEADARKMVNYECEIRQLTKKAMNGDADAKKKLEETEKEAEEFGKKMAERHKDKINDKAYDEKYDKIEDEIMSKCN